MTIYCIKKTNGITLVELIVTIVILSIVMTAAYSFFIFGNKTYNKGIDQYSVQSNIRLSSDYITKEVRFATEIEILSFDSDNINNIIDSPLSEISPYDNYIVYHDGEIKQVSRYSSKTYTIGEGGKLIFSSSNPGEILNLSIEGVDSGQSYNIDSELRPLNLKLEGNTINYSVVGDVIRYVTADNYLAKLAAPIATPGDLTNPLSFKVHFNEKIVSFRVLLPDSDDPNVRIIDTNNMEFYVPSPGAISGAEVVIMVLMENGYEYEYTIEFYTNWNIIGAI